MISDEDRARRALSAVDELEAVLAAARSFALRIGGPEARNDAGTFYRARRLRDFTFGSHATLFGEPAWDILLDLSAARTMEKSITVSSACIGSCAPPTTGLRHLAALEAHGLVVRRAHPGDGRKCFVEISDSGNAMMQAWLERLEP